MTEEFKRLQDLRDSLFNGLRDKCPDIVLNGSMENLLPDNLNVSFLGIQSETLMNSLHSNPFLVLPELNL